MPKVTVLLPVYNGEAFLEEAVNSVLRQSFRDFELLIMDDGSTDNTLSVAGRFKDPRIRLEKRQHDFIGNLNEGIRLAQGKYIARMDADDIMHTERLRVQVGVMEKNPEIAVCGSWMKNFGEGIVPGVVRSFNGEISFPLLQLLKGNILFHYRNSALQVTYCKREKMEETSRRIGMETVGLLLERFSDEKVKTIVNALLGAEEQGIVSSETLRKVLFEIFHRLTVRPPYTR